MFPAVSPAELGSTAKRSRNTSVITLVAFLMEILILYINSNQGVVISTRRLLLACYLNRFAKTFSTTGVILNSTRNSGPKASGCSM